MKINRPYLIVILVSLLFFYEFGLNNIFDALQAHIANSFNLTPTTMGVISSIFFYVEILLLIPAGLLLDRYSAKKLISLVLLLSAIGVIITAYSNSIAMLVFARILMGIGGAFSFVGCVRVAVNWLKPNQLARGTGLIATMGILGGFVVQLPLTYLISLMGWRNALMIVGVIGVVITGIIFFSIQDRPSTSGDVHSVINPMKAFHRFKLAFFNKQNFYCGLYTSLMNLPIFMLGAMWGIAYMTQVNHITELQASTVCSMLFIGTMIGSPLVGLISDKIVNRKLPMQIGGGLSLILMLIIMFCNTQSLALLIFFYLMLGLLTSTQMIGYPTVIESNSKMISSSATSVISILSMVAGAIVQPLFGYIVYKVSGGNSATIQGYGVAMWLLPLAFVIAIITSFLIKETHCKHID